MPQPALASTPAALIDVSDYVDVGLVVIDERRIVHTWNRWTVRHSGRDASLALGNPLSIAFGTPIDARLDQSIQQVLSRNISVRLSHALHPKPLPLFLDPQQPIDRIKQAVTLTPVTLPNGERGCLIQISDMTSMVRRESLLREQAVQLKQEIERLAEAQERVSRGEKRFSQLAEQAPVGIFEINADGDCVFVNQRFCQMTGLSRDDVIAGGLASAIHPEDRKGLAQRLSEPPDIDRRPFSGELRVIRPDGSLVWVRLDSTPTPGADGRIWHIGTCVDITESKQRTLQFEFRANHDPLTGLLNRERFDARLRVAVAGTVAVGGHAALLYIDLDAFKPINDTYGHAAGDAVLKAVAQRLRTVLRTDDQPARLGGDEFAILIADVVNPDVPRVVAAKVREALEQPIWLGDRRMQVGCSIGCAQCPDDAKDAEGLMQLADQRMYEDKRSRRANRPR